MHEIRESSLKKPNPANEYDPIKLKSISELVWGYFAEKKILNLFITRVIDRLTKAGCTTLMERSQIDRHLREVARRCPSWLSVVPNVDGDILRQCKSHQIPEIYKLLDL